MAAPTCQVVAKRLLRDLGVTSLDPATPALQNFPLQPGDLDDIAGIMTATIQELAAVGPVEARNRDVGAWLNPPAQVTLTCTEGSATISGLTTWATWMLGCTINIVGDGYNNELNSQTTLSRPFAGGTGATTATVYADCVQLDDTIGMVLPPVMIPPQWPLISCDTREGFMSVAGYPLVTDSNGAPYGWPGWWFTQKAIGRPVAWFLDSYYDSTKTYLPRRLRVGPMPNTGMSLAYRVALNPIRIETTDIDGAAHADPGVVIPVPSTWVETIYIPMCRKRVSGLAQFRNAASVAEIDRAYRQAVRTMQGAGFGQGSVQQGIYI